MYELGDNCLQYAKCGIQNNKCQQIENTQFTQWKSCVQKCIDNNKNDNMKEFECESKCSVPNNQHQSCSKDDCPQLPCVPNAQCPFNHCVNNKCTNS